MPRLSPVPAGAPSSVSASGSSICKENKDIIISENWPWPRPEVNHLNDIQDAAILSGHNWNKSKACA